MDQQALQNKLNEIISNPTFQEGDEMLTVYVDAGEWKEVAQKLKSDEDLYFGYPGCITCIDWEQYFEMVYILESFNHGHELKVKVQLEDRENPKIDTVTDIWPGAELPEDEVYDLFGIYFTDHPNLRRIFLDEDWEGHPLRKDYYDPINIVDL